MALPSAEDPWSDEALKSTLRDYFGVGADADLSDEIRFLGGVARLIQKRIINGELDVISRLPGIFFLHPSHPSDVTGRPTSRVPMLDNGLHSVSNRLWFVNKVASDGTFVELSPDDDDGKVFDLAVNEFNVGDLPTIVFEPRTKPAEARYYPGGLSKTDTYRLLRIDPLPISLDQIFEVIERLYQQEFCTPDAQGRAGKLWAKASHNWVAEDAEYKIQAAIRTGLIGSFPTCNVRVEQFQATGRLDVELEEPSALDRTKITRHALLELKVLRSRRSTGSVVPASRTKNWVREGVEQAYSYRKERGCLHSALCCFDMRLSPVEFCFEHVEDLASQLAVALKSWYLFSSSEAYRHHLATTARGQEGPVDA
ncbi:hypothetical protein ACIBI3_34170 [Actinomadura luteofluorescens]|uniref:hypothetical protein n=1 Tax=Actinomadura luteofluorescens TaxID=46163 RepID=UPI003491F51A